MLSPEQPNHNQAINNLIASIALQESFFVDTIYTEAKRLTDIVNSQGITPAELYTSKNCLSELTHAITGLERILQAKLSFLNPNFQNKNLHRGGFLTNIPFFL